MFLAPAKILVEKPIIKRAALLEAVRSLSEYRDKKYSPAVTKVEE